MNPNSNNDKKRSANQATIEQSDKEPKRKRSKSGTPINSSLAKVVQNEQKTESETIDLSSSPTDQREPIVVIPTTKRTILPLPNLNIAQTDEDDDDLNVIDPKTTPGNIIPIIPRIPKRSSKSVPPINKQQQSMLQSGHRNDVLPELSLFNQRLCEIKHSQLINSPYFHYGKFYSANTNIPKFFNDTDSINKSVFIQHPPLFNYAVLPLKYGNHVILDFNHQII